MSQPLSPVHCCVQGQAVKSAIGGERDGERKGAGEKLGFKH